MYIVQVNSEWDLGIPMLYANEEVARNAVEEALPRVGLDEGLAAYEGDWLISFENVWVVEG
jgi:hypothetical protein